MGVNVNRRRALAMTVGIIAVPQRATASPAAAARPTSARIDSVTEEHFGIPVSDPYRWMEAESPEWRLYAEAQGAQTTELLNSIPKRAEIVRELSTLLGRTTSFGRLQVAGSRLFSLKQLPGAQNYRLFVRYKESSSDDLIVDPATFAGRNANIDWWSASPTGEHVAFGVSSDGTERAVTRVLEVKTYKLLAETLEGIVLMPASWAPDGQSFFYNRLNPTAPKSGPEALKRTSCWHHRLNTSQADDVCILGHASSLATPIADTERPLIIATPSSDVLILRIRAGISNYVRLYVGSLSGFQEGRPNWRPICAADDQVTEVAVRGSDIYLLAKRNAPNGRILRVTAERPSIIRADLVVQGGDGIIMEMVASRDGLYLVETSSSKSLIRFFSPDKSVREIPVPKKGVIDYLYGDVEHDGAWIGLEDWSRPITVYQIHADGTVSQSDFAPAPPIDVSGYVSEEVTYRSHDGVFVPLSVTYRKGLTRDGSAPLLLEAYGAYGDAAQPFFDPARLPLLDRGGVYAFAHVRGGGERGEAWHVAGQKATKPNTWLDMIAAAEHLIAKGYTSSAKLAVLGASAGGIAVGRFITERPELAAVAISQSGDLDSIRLEATAGGPANIPEFGTVTTPEGFRGLLEMDAYQHVLDGTAYPAVMLCTGLNDPRVPPWEATKMIARLQKATSSGKPVLLRVDANAGHFSSANEQVIQTWADILSFIFWQTHRSGFSAG